MDESPISDIHPATCSAVVGPSGSENQSGKKINVQVCPTTGGEFTVELSNSETVEGLKKAIHRKIKVSKERINVLHKDRILKDGTLLENQVVDGSRLTLLPNIESGLVSQKADNTVMQALENLTEPQVNEFLAGKAPLTLAMRLGDHMMFVQLQLSTSNPARKSASRSIRRRMTNSSRSSTAPSAVAKSSSVVKNTAGMTDTGSSKLKMKSTTCDSPASPPPETNFLSDLDQLPSTSSGVTTASDTSDNDKPVLNTAALAQASRNLSQKLRQLSAASSQLQKVTESVSPPTSKPPGAIIESMQHHGHGVYSGTFSGTLNPALQDSEGKPKKDVGTIIHILNDLLGAQPGGRIHPAGKLRRSHDKSARNSKSKLSGVDKVRLTQENRATKGKMEQIRAMLEERRQKRRERQEAKVSETFCWETRERNGSDSSMTENEDIDMESTNVEASVTDNVAEADTGYTNLAHESSILA